MDIKPFYQIFHDIEQMFSSPQSRINRIYKFLDKFLERLDKHHIFLLAAGIAFSILLYLVPLFLVTVFVVSQIVEPETLTRALQNIVKELLPPTDQTQNLLMSIISEVNYIFTKSSIAGWIGIFVLLWVSSAFFSALRSGLNIIFEISSPKFFVVYKLKDILVTIALTLLLLFSTYIFPLLTVIKTYLLQLIPSEIEWVFSWLILTAVSLVTSFIFFYLMFRFVPNRRAPRKVRIMSTVLCVVLIEISRHLFAWYLSTLSNFGRFYGSYAVIASIALWIYYLTLIILFSSEISQYLYDRKHSSKVTAKE